MFIGWFGAVPRRFYELFEAPKTGAVDTRVAMYEVSKILIRSFIY